MRTTDTIDLDRLAGELRRLAEKLERLSRRTTTAESLILDALGSLGPLSAYRIQKVTRRGRERVYAALRALQAEGRIERAREGYRLTVPGSQPVEVERVEPRANPPVDPQIEIERGNPEREAR